MAEREKAIAEAAAKHEANRRAGSGGDIRRLKPFSGLAGRRGCAIPYSEARDREARRGQDDGTEAAKIKAQKEEKERKEAAARAYH